MAVLSAKKEQMIYRSMQGVSKEEFRQRVESNAAQLNITLNDDIHAVIDTLLQHYEAHLADDRVENVHRDFRFLETAFKDKGGSKYLTKLFPTGQGVLNTIHKLTGLPQLELDIDSGYGTAF